MEERARGLLTSPSQILPHLANAFPQSPATTTTTPKHPLPKEPTSQVPVQPRTTSKKKPGSIPRKKPPQHTSKSSKNASGKEGKEKKQETLQELDLELEAANIESHSRGQGSVGPPGHYSKTTVIQSAQKGKSTSSTSSSSSSNPNVRAIRGRPPLKGAESAGQSGPTKRRKRKA